MEDGCANCDNPSMSYGGTWQGRLICWECKKQGFYLADEQRERAEKAERERDEEESRFQSGRALIRHQENTIRSLAGQVASLQPGSKDCALRVRAERAEKALKRAREERDEARAQAVWAEPVYYPGATVPLWRVYCPPGGTPLATEGWGGLGILDFATEAEALAAGRAVPWWTQAEGVD